MCFRKFFVLIMLAISKSQIQGIVILFAQLTVIPQTPYHRMLVIVTKPISSFVFMLLIFTITMQENTDLNGFLKHELIDKYKNALPHDTTSESTFGKCDLPYTLT